MLYTSLDCHRSFSCLMTISEKGEIVDFLRSFGEAMEVAIEATPSGIDSMVA